jgi:hypothetical protein
MLLQVVRKTGYEETREQAAMIARVRWDIMVVELTTKPRK